MKKKGYIQTTLERVSLSTLFIRRPVGTALLTLAITLVGIAAFWLLPVAPLPQVDMPIIRIRAQLPGAGPETMASSVATPLERSLGRISGITELTSQSSLGSSSVIVQFDMNKDINQAAREVQAAINTAVPNLPSGIPSNPEYHKMNPSGMPIMIMAITSDTLSQSQMYDTASTVLAQKIAQVSGVGDVNVGGGDLPAIRVQLSPQALNRAGISMDDVKKAISNTNASGPKGILANEQQQWIVEANDQLRSPADYASLIIHQKNNAVVRLGDVATIITASLNNQNMALADGKQAILLIIFRAPGANIIETVDRIKSMLPGFRSMLPEGANLHVALDRSVTIRASVHEVEFTLMLSITLVILVTFLFLRNGRATSIPAVAVPVSLIGTFAVMYLCGYTLDNLSLMALTIATGFVVDDAIVVLENIVRHLEKGKKPILAAIDGAREVGFTVVSITLSLVAVFIPILFMGGIPGRLFREFSVVLATAVLVSMVISLTTTPMMCAYLLNNTPPRPPQTIWGRGWLSFTNFCHTCLDKLERAYARSLQHVLHHRRLTLLALFIVIGLNIYLYVVSPKGFFPQQDTGQLMGGMRTDQSSSFLALQEKFTRLMKIMLEDPAVLHVSGHISGGRGGGGVVVELKPLKERKVSADAVIARLRKKLSSEPGINIFLQAAQDLHMGGRSARAQYQYTLQSDNLATLRLWAPKLDDELWGNSPLQDVNSDLDERAIQTYIDFDRDRMAHLGISMSDAIATLGNAYGQSQISTIYMAQNQYKVVMEFAPYLLYGPDSLDHLYVPGRDGLVPLTTIATIGTNFAARSVAHQSQFAAVTLSFNLPPGMTLEQAEAIIENARIRIGMPSSIIGSFQGTGKLFTEAMQTQILLILAALLTLYIVLGILYESLIHPLTILSTLPSAGIGALLALMLFGMEFSIIALIGVLLLCGLVKKNAIMMIDFALEASRTQKLGPQMAIYKACVLRFRPIMMTTAAAILGAVPLVLGRGDGAELRQPLGVTIVGGLLVSQLLTLYTTPIVYLYLDTARQRVLRRWWSMRRGPRYAHLRLLLHRERGQIR